LLNLYGYLPGLTTCNWRNIAIPPLPSAVLL
jgi:hypothetical protein